MASVLQSIKMSTFVFLSGSSTTYTVPANSYAVLTVTTNSASGNTININAGTLINIGSASPFTIYLGPAQSIKPTNTDVFIVGTEFINTT